MSHRRIAKDAKKNLRTPDHPSLMKVRHLGEEKAHSLQWEAEFDRQIKKYNLDGELWMWHFGIFGILPDDAHCGECADHSIDCPNAPGNPLHCMRSNGQKRMSPSSWFWDDQEVTASQFLDNLEKKDSQNGVKRENNPGGRA